MTFVEVTVGRSVIYLIPNNWLIKFDFCQSMFSPPFCLELRSFLIPSLKCEIFVVISELGLSRTLL